MLRISDICMITLGFGLLSASPALAQDAITAPAQKTIGATKAKVVPSLAVLNSAAQR